MFLLQSPHNYTSQPQGKVEVDWSNPITKSLIFAYPDIGRGSTDASSSGGQVGYNNANPLFTLTPAGFGLFHNADFIQAVANPNRLNQFDRTKDFSLLGICYQTFLPTTAVTQIASLWTDNGQLVDINANNTGNFKATIYNSSTAPIGSLESITQRTANKFYVLILTRRVGAGFSLYVNGVLESSIADLARTLEVSVTNTRWVGSLGGANPNNGTAHMGGALFNRLLTDSEIQSISANPWQIFRRPSSIWLPPYVDYSPPQAKQFFPVSTSTGTRTSQPQGKVEVDWSNPICRGLVFDFNGATNSSVLGTIERNANQGDRVNKRGKARYYNKTTGTIFAVRPFQAQQVTALCVAALGGQSVSFPDIFAANISNTTTAWAFEIPTGGTAQNSVALYGIATNTGFVESAVSNLFVNSGVRTVVARISDVLAIFFDGISIAVTGAAATTTATVSKFQIGTRTDNAQGSSRMIDDCSLNLILFWNRALSDAEIRRISANPWQIFKPQQNHAPVPYIKTKAYTQSKTFYPVTGKEPFYNQPQGRVEVDWGNPITKGLLFSGNNRSDYIDGRGLLFDGTATVSISEYGLVYSGFSANANNRIRTLNKNIPNSGNITIFAIVSSGSSGTILSNGGSGPGAGVRIDIRGAGNVGVTYGGILDYQNSVGSINLDRPTPVAYVAEGTVGRYYLNGYVDSRNLTVSATRNTPSVPIALGTNHGGSSYQGTFSGTIIAPLVWTRALSAAEVKSISENPWQIFKRNSRTYIPQFTEADVSRPQTDIQIQGWSPSKLGTIAAMLEDKETDLSDFASAKIERPVLPIRLLGTRLSQPQGYTGVDWGNPVTKNLQFTLSTSSVRNVVNTNPPSFDTSTRGLGTGGISRNYSKGSNQITIFSSPVPYGNNIPSVLVAEFEITSLTGGGTILAVKSGNTTAVSGTSYYRIGYESDGRIHAAVWNGVSYASCSTIKQFPVNQKIKAVALFPDTRQINSVNFVLSVNGVIETTTTTPTTFNQIDATLYPCVGGAIGSGDAANARVFSASIISNILLPTATLNSLSNNPWQIFNQSNTLYIPQSYSDPLVTTISPLPIGTHTMQFTADVTIGQSQATVTLLDDFNQVVGVATVQVDPTTLVYNAPVTTTGIATRMKITIS